MVKKEIKFALVQDEFIPTRINENKGKILRYIRKAVKDKADVVVFPENAITGYQCCDKFLDNEFIEENLKALKEIRKFAANKKITVIVGFVDSEDSRRYNAAAIIQGRKMQKIHKVNLPNYDFFDEKRYYDPGKTGINNIFSVNGCKIGVVICLDFWKEKEVRKLKECDYFISINASPYGHTKSIRRINQAESYVDKFAFTVIYLNTVGIEDNLKNVITLHGNSFVLTSKKKLMLMKDLKRDYRIFALSEIKHFDLKIPGIVESKFRLIVHALKRYARINGFKKAVIGVSGGVDSAVTAVIAKQVFGKNLLAVSMPSAYNRPKLMFAAKRLAKNLGIQFAEDEIDGFYKYITLDYIAKYGKISNKVMLENLQSRIRMLKLMAISNDQNRLLIGTSNKTEIALGYATLYGDMAAGILPIGDVNKRHVKNMALWINQNFGDVIPAETIEAKPDAELSPDSKGDPFDYSLVSDLCDLIIQQNNEKIKMYIKKKKLSKMYVDSIRKRISDNSFKRAYSAPLIISSEKAFGFDYRECIIR